MNKQQWLDWVEHHALRLKSRYGLSIVPHTATPRHSAPNHARQWSAMPARVAQEDGGIVVHVDLPKPHTREAVVRIIGSTLSIAVLRSGSDIDHAAADECYRRAIPLPSEMKVDTESHSFDGDRLVIRLRPKPQPKASGRRPRPSGDQRTAG